MTEKERKFLVKDYSWLPQVRHTEWVTQVYVDDRFRIRITKKDGNKHPVAKLGFKSPGLFSREEYEFEIPHQQAIWIANLYQDRKVQKMRYTLWHKGGLPWQIDVFQGENEGLILAEKEGWSDDDRNKKIDLPSWAGEEVTDDERYYNNYLSKKPYKKWKKK